MPDTAAPTKTQLHPMMVQIIRHELAHAFGLFASYIVRGGNIPPNLADKFLIAAHIAPVDPDSSGMFSGDRHKVPQYGEGEILPAPPDDDNGLATVITVMIEQNRYAKMNLKLRDSPVSTDDILALEKFMNSQDELDEVERRSRALQTIASLAIAKWVAHTDLIEQFQLPQPDFRRAIFTVDMRPLFWAIKPTIEFIVEATLAFHKDPNEVFRAALQAPAVDSTTPLPDVKFYNFPPVDWPEQSITSMTIGGIEFNGLKPITTMKFQEGSDA